MSLFLWVLLGIGAAITADKLDSKRATGGILGAVLLGAAGALVGGILANLVLGQSILRLDIATFLLSVMGAMMVILIHRTALAR
jgi:uncharacterized membrane protein YeaQ/YmgE (transglycosylase-associated protein family)